MTTYGSLDGVAAYVQHATVNGSFPTTATSSKLAQATVQTFLNQRAAILAGWVAAAGYQQPTTGDAKAALDGFANLGAAGDVELSLVGAGYDEDDQNRRENKFLSLFASAKAWIDGGALGQLGIPVLPLIPARSPQAQIGLIVAGRDWKPR